MKHFRKKVNKIKLQMIHKLYQKQTKRIANTGESNKGGREILNSDS